MCCVVDAGELLRRVTRPRWLVAIGTATLLVAVWASATPAAVSAIGGPPGGRIKQRGYNDFQNPTMSELVGERTVGGGQARAVEVWIGYGIVSALALLIGFCLVLIIRQLVHRSVREPLAEADPTGKHREAEAELRKTLESRQK